MGAPGRVRLGLHQKQTLRRKTEVHKVALEGYPPEILVGKWGCDTGYKGWAVKLPM